MIKEDNQSDKHLTIAGLTVLGDVQSRNLTQLQRQVQENFDKTQNLTAEQKDFWSKLADDNLITPIEKKELKKELSIISQTYTSIMKLAREKGDAENPVIVLFDAKYKELQDYIVKIKLFDNMADSTKVDKKEFTEKFTNYYDNEVIAQSIFTGKTSATIRVLSSLFETGTMNEVATYRGVFYKWNGKQWVLVNGNEYLGMFNHLPEADINDYFLCADNFTARLKLIANGKQLKTDGKVFYVNTMFIKGFIYVSTDKGWKKIENKSDYRYLLATSDLISLGEISTGLEEAIASKQPRYLGLFYDLPTEYKKNDWFTYAGVSTETYTQGRVYKWNGEEWELVTAESKNYQMLMTSLTDIINANPSGEGYFTTIFAQALISSQAFIQNLQSQIITLQNGGRIQSENYEQGKLGFLLDSNGVFECSVGTFRGSIESGPLVLNTTSPGVSSFSFSPSDTVLTLYTKLKSYGINESVDTIKVNNKSEVVKLEESSTTTNEPEICYFRTNKEFYGTVYIIEQWEKQTTTEKKTVILKNSNRTLTYVRTHSIHTKKIKEISQQAEEPSYPKRDTRGTVNVQDPSINQTLSFVVNQNATTFKLLYLPVNTGNLTTGTVYVENGFLKIV